MTCYGPKRSASVAASPPIYSLIRTHNPCSYLRNIMANEELTRSQAVARLADRTASQHPRGSRDVIGHVTIR